jgi:hypothetical protein
MEGQDLGEPIEENRRMAGPKHHNVEISRLTTPGNNIIQGSMPQKYATGTTSWYYQLTHFPQLPQVTYSCFRFKLRDRNAKTVHDTRDKAPRAYDVGWNIQIIDGTISMGVLQSLSYGMWNLQECMCTTMKTRGVGINQLLDQGHDPVHGQQPLGIMTRY